MFFVVFVKDIEFANARKILFDEGLPQTPLVSKRLEMLLSLVTS